MKKYHNSPEGPHDESDEVHQARVVQLLDLIDKCRSLPIEQQEALRPLIEETLERFNQLSRDSKIIRDFADVLEDLFA